VEIFPFISLLIFFIVVTVWAIRADKERMEKMQQLPLQPDKLNGRNIKM